MATQAALNLLRADLGFAPGAPVPESVEDLLQNLLDTARDDLSTFGVALNTSAPADLHLMSMYAAWLYRKRVSGDSMPAMLRAAINNRKVTAATSPAAVGSVP